MKIKLSPNGQYIAYEKDLELIITCLNDNKKQIINLKDELDDFWWSHDSILISGSYRTSMIQIWCLDDLTWECIIYEPMCGFDCLSWSPDSRHILVMMKKLCRITIWSLVDKFSVLYIKDIKFNHGKQISKKLCEQQIGQNECQSQMLESVAFLPNGSILAVLELGEPKQFNKISLFQIIYGNGSSDKNVNWKLEKSIDLPSNHFEGFLWSPDSKHICVWEHFYYGTIYVYDIGKGSCMAKIDLKTLEEQIVPCPQTMVECMWTPNQPLFLAVWCFPDYVLLYNCITWNLFFNLKHPNTLAQDDITLVHEETLIRQGINSSSIQVDNETQNAHMDDKSCNLGKTFQDKDFTNEDYSIDTRWESKYLVNRKRPYNFNVISLQDQRFCETRGKSKLAFSSDNHFVATFTIRTPNCIYVWSLTSGVLVHVLVHKLPVSDFAWHPHHDLLAICTGSQCCFLWTPVSCATYRETTTAAPHEDNESIKMQGNRMIDINITSLKWTPNGTELVVTCCTTDSNEHPYRIIKFTKEFIEDLCTES